MIRVVLPQHLRTLAQLRCDVELIDRRPGHATLGPGRARSPLSDVAWHDSRSGYAATPSLLAVLRLRRGSVPPTARGALARCGRLRSGTPHHHRCNRWRLAVGRKCSVGARVQETINRRRFPKSYISRPRSISPASPSAQTPASHARSRLVWGARSSAPDPSPSPAIGQASPPCVELRRAQ